MCVCVSVDGGGGLAGWLGCCCWWEFPFDGGEDHSSICIYSNQSVNTVHGANKGRPMGGPRSPLRPEKEPPTSRQLSGREPWPRVMWEPRGPPSGAE